MKSQLLGWRPVAVAMVAAAILLLAAGCQQSPQKSEGDKKAADATAEIPQPMLDALHGKRPEGAPAEPASTAPAMPAQGMSMRGGVAKVPTNIIVPDEVKKGWKAVIVEVTEVGGKPKDYTVNINGQLAIPGSDLTLKVESFLPDFKMTPQGITSLSNEPKNPAARVSVEEGGKTIFKGWLFKLFPEAHPFQHPRYRMVLKDWVAA